LYSGPVAESLPTSVSAFSHRRPRADSTTSFTYYDDEAEPPLEDDESDGLARRHISEDYVRRSVSDIGDLEFGAVDETDDDDVSSDRDLDETRNDYVLRRHSSAHSRASIHDRLLRRDSTGTVGSFLHHGRTNQKIYMVNEDLTIVVAGFRSSQLGYLLYVLSCILTGGLAYLLFRWMPRWYVSILGRASPLRECDWVVIENQWGELVTMTVKSQPYGRSLSTVFGSTEKHYSDAFDEDSDPIIDDLRTLDYRYVRLCFHPLKDKFTLCNGWKDPSWNDIRLARAGLDSDEKSIREAVFGPNLIDIEQKTTGQLLVDEVNISAWVPPHLDNIADLPGPPPLLHLSNCQSCALVS
jgi:cation-transporting ATPase 13A2